MERFFANLLRVKNALKFQIKSRQNNINHSGTAYRSCCALSVHGKTDVTAICYKQHVKPINAILISISVAFVALSGLSSCTSSSSDSNSSGDSSKPRVLYLDPKIDDVDVSLNTKIVVKFNEALAKSSVGADAISLMPENSANQSSVPGNVEYTGTNDEFVLIFTPNADLQPLTSYLVTISSAVTDLNGNHGSLYQYKFTTGSASGGNATPPTVVATVPANQQTSIAVNRSIVVTFSELMDAATIDRNSFYLTNNNNNSRVNANVSYANFSATLVPSSSLSTNTSYTATIAATVRDVAGNAMGVDYVWSFSTGGNNNNDQVAPTVSLVTPNDNTTNISVNSVITAVFSEPLDSSTVSSGSFTLNAASTTGIPPANDVAVPVAGSVTYSGTTAVFTPNTILDADKQYTARLSTTIKDLAGNSLSQSVSWTFHTETVVIVDNVPPSVTAESPQKGALDVATNAAVSAQFSEGLDPTSINTATFTLSDTLNGGGTVINSNISYDGVNAVLRPLNVLLDNTLYTATLTTGIKDLAGNNMIANYAWTFRTSAVLDTTPPMVAVTNPSDGAINVATNSAVSAQFSEVLDAATVNSTTFVLTPAQAGAAAIQSFISYNGLTATLTPAAPLQPGSYIATLTTGITDLAGNSLANNVTWTFSTTTTDNTPPDVLSYSPANNATNVATTISAISATFNEALDPNSVGINNNVRLTNNATGATVTGSVSYANNTITFSPSGVLAFFTTYTAIIDDTVSPVTDLAGNAVTQTYTWSFTTVRAGGGMGGGDGGGGGGGGGG